jgi:hypothetical protein
LPEKPKDNKTHVVFVLIFSIKPPIPMTMPYVVISAIIVDNHMTIIPIQICKNVLEDILND